jgi:hypothetical protein
MLTILAPKPGNSGFCDGVSRRNFLKIGALGLGGLALPQLLQAEAVSGIDVSKTTVPDLSGRPQFLVDQGLQPMRELLG